MELKCKEINIITLFARKKKLVKITRKLDEEEEGACIDCRWSITEFTHSLFSGLRKRKKITQEF